MGSFSHTVQQIHGAVAGTSSTAMLENHCSAAPPRALLNTIRVFCSLGQMVQWDSRAFQTGYSGCVLRQVPAILSEWTLQLCMGSKAIVSGTIKGNRGDSAPMLFGLWSLPVAECDCSWETTDFYN